MGLKVSTSKEDIGSHLNMYSVNRDISLNQPCFRKCGKKIKLLLTGKDCELDPENSELFGGQLMRYSESKGQKIGVVCKRIDLTSTVIKFQKTVTWAKIWEWCCVVFTIVWNNNYLQQ